MGKRDVSRRNFLRAAAAGTTGTALAALPAGHSAAAAEPPVPVAMVSYPVVEPGNNARLAELKLVTKEKIPGAYQEKLRALAPNLELTFCPNGEGFLREVADAHIIYGVFTREEYNATKNLRWIQYRAAGVDELLYPELVNSPVILTNMQRIHSPAISETAIGLLLSLTRGLNRYALQTRDHVWNSSDDSVEISGLTLGLVGLGGIGTDTAYRAHYGFKMKVLAVDPKPLPKPAFVAELHSPEWLPHMVPQVDVLMSAAPHTSLTKGMFNEGVFRAMKPSAYFINVTGGTLVDTPALIRALKEKWIAGAGLDVAYLEPLPPNDPLWSAGNLIISSHSSGVSDGTMTRKYELLCENMRRYVSGLPLLNVVDKVRGY